MIPETERRDSESYVVKVVTIRGSPITEFPEFRINTLPNVTLDLIDMIYQDAVLI